MNIDFDISVLPGTGRFKDQLDVSGLRNKAGDPVTVSDVGVSEDGSGNAKLTFPEGEEIVLIGVTVAQVQARDALHAAGIPQALPTDMIETPFGPRAIHDLREGDDVLTVEFGVQPIYWIDRISFGDCAHLLSGQATPVRIRQKAFGNSNAFTVSHQQCILFECRLTNRMFYVRAKHLAEETDLASFAKGCFRLSQHHVVLRQHATLIINGTPCASFYPGKLGLAMSQTESQDRLLKKFPGLEHEPVERAYGPRAAPIIGRSAFLRGYRSGTIKVPWINVSAAAGAANLCAVE